MPGCHSHRRCSFSTVTPPLWPGPRIQAPVALFMATMGAATTTSTIPVKCTICRSSKRIAHRVGHTKKKGLVGGVVWAAWCWTWSKSQAMTKSLAALVSRCPPRPTHNVLDGTQIVKRFIILMHNHEAEAGPQFLFVPSISLGSLDPGVGRVVALRFFSMPLMFTEGPAFQSPRPAVCPIPASWNFLRLN